MTGLVKASFQVRFIGSFIGFNGAFHIVEEAVALKMGECPRCGTSNTAKYGLVPMKVGKTRSILVNVYVCAKCRLVFYERMEEKLGSSEL